MRTVETAIALAAYITAVEAYATADEDTRMAAWIAVENADDALRAARMAEAE